VDLRGEVIEPFLDAGCFEDGGAEELLFGDELAGEGEEGGVFGDDFVVVEEGGDFAFGVEGEELLWVAAFCDDIGAAEEGVSEGKLGFAEEDVGGHGAGATEHVEVELGRGHGCGRSAMGCFLQVEGVV